MIRTRVGYAGGTTPGPTYRDLGDHSESIEIDYDPARIRYAELLEIFYRSHTPVTRLRQPQYRSRIFYRNDLEKRLAMDARARASERLGRTIYTEILPFRAFTRAEDYHQKYYLRHAREIAADLFAMYPQVDDFTDSTAATRLNGYLGGNGTPEVIAAQLPGLGLTPAGEKAVHRIVLLE